MRGNAHVARTWLEAGCFLSFGARFNPAALRVTPLDRLLIETDDSPVTIHEVANFVAQTLGLPINTILTTVATNARCSLRSLLRV